MHQLQRALSPHQHEDKDRTSPHVPRTIIHAVLSHRYPPPTVIHARYPPPTVIHARYPPPKIPTSTKIRTGPALISHAPLSTQYPPPGPPHTLHIFCPVFAALLLLEPSTKTALITKGWVKTVCQSDKDGQIGYFEPN
eukprot:1161539-Pelagomonas_calceolata.AAC.5